MLYLRLLKESLIFAIDSLIVNKLRTILSLLGITIGIFAMVSVFTMVDSLENNIRSSISSLGDNVIYVAQMPWDFDPNQAWWDYIRRPQPDLDEFKMLKKQLQNAESVAMLVGGSHTVKYKNNSMDNVQGTGVTSEYNKIWDLKIEKGRYITELESNSGRPVTVIGADIASSLFGTNNPLGKKIKIKGRKVEVIGVIEKEGESMMGQSNDRKMFMPLQFARNFYNLRSRSSGAVIMVKAKPNSLDALTDELTGVMRSLRKLKPKVKDNFALNKMSMISQGFDQIFGVINISGFVIGIFSILVGGFSIANIMFVSVKERTSLIGIQKSLGAKNFFILFQFLFESVFLCLIGGAVGLFFIFIGTLVMTYVADFPTTLGLNNILLGFGLSAGIGIIAGIVPSYQASRLDPVEAIRAN
ncbi:MAG: putative ABC transport system permease protein [Vicingaceae bacterium]|jgi:putative ABC transport system permease protein